MLGETNFNLLFYRQIVRSENMGRLVGKIKINFSDFWVGKDLKKIFSLRSYLLLFLLV